MTKSIKIISIVFLFLFSLVPLAFAAEPLKDLFYDQGQEALNAPPIHGITENVDLFSGNLSILYTDAHFPGNGGLDVTLIRKYNSAIWGRRDVTPTLVENLNQSPLGLGWSMHMGIVRNPYGTGSGDNLYLSNDPVLEMPDGSQHILYVDKNDATRFISKDYWVYKPNGIPGQWTLTLADGTVYTFEFSELQTKAGYYAYAIGSGTSTQVAQVIKIENAAKTATITITYDKTIAQGSSYLNTITDSVGRAIKFQYNSSHQLDSIWLDSNRKLMSYSYQSFNGVYGPYSILSEAVPPVGPTWKYSYSSIYELQTLTYPTGGTITYQFSDVPFYIRPYDSTPQALVSFSVVTRKTINNGAASGVFTYSYTTGGTSSALAFNVTTVTVAPDNVTEVHRFNGWGNCKGGTVYAVGLPFSKEFSRNGSTYYAELSYWTFSEPISDQWIGNGPWNNGYTTAADAFIYVPRLTHKVVILDGNIAWENNGNPDSNGLVQYSTTGQVYDTKYNSYDYYGNPTSITEHSYDFDWNPTAARNIAKTYFYNTSLNVVLNKPLQITISGGFPGTFATTNTYDGNGNLAQVDNYGIKTDFTYDLSTNNLSSITDANNNRTSFDWDNGRISRKTNPLYSVYRTINRDGTIADETDGNNHKTFYTYDDNFRLTSKTPPIGNPTTIIYDPNGTSKQTSRGGYYSYTYYDGFGRTARTVNSIGVENDIVYSTYGPKNYTASNTGDTVHYDLMARVTKIEHKDASAIDYEYLGGYTWVNDEEDHTTELVYNSFGNPDEKWIIEAIDEISATTYDYNMLGSLLAIHQPGNINRTFSYNPKNFLVAEIHPDRGTITYTRDNVGNMATKTDGMGTTNYTYDDLNRLTQLSNGSGTISRAYDHADNKLSTYNASANIDYTYDATNKMKQKTENIGGRSFSTQYDYDENDNLTDIRYPSARSAHYDYNNNNQVIGVSGFGGTISNISYYTPADNTTAIGLPYQYTYSNGHVTILTYNDRNLTTKITAGQTAVNMNYSYDFRGNTTAITNQINNESQILAYDALNRLTGFNGIWGTGAFSYDALGNRQAKQVGSNYITYGYTNNRLASATSGGITASYTYNFDGDLTDVDGRSLVYNEFHNLLSYGDGVTPLAQYTYDGDGMRVTKTTSDGKAVVYHYDQGGRILTESDGNGNFISDYVYLHGKLVAKIVNDTLIPPNASPTNLTATAVSSSQINLTWVNNATNTGGYVVERELASGGTYTQVATLPANATSYSDADLPENTSYTYRVRAYNNLGFSQYSNEATARTWPTTVPNAPSGLVTQTITYNRIVLVWTDNSNNESGFVIERKSGASGAYVQVATVDVNVTSYSDTTVSLSSMYIYRVKAINIVGASQYSNEVGVTTPAGPMIGIITTIAGNGQASFSGDGGPATQASLNNPSGVAVDGAGNIYIADSLNGDVRKVDTNSNITTIANGLVPGAVAVGEGNVYVSDAGVGEIISILNSTVIAGVGTNLYGGFGTGPAIGDGGPATQAPLNRPGGVTVDGAGNIYIADTYNDRIRKVDTFGIITTVAGNGYVGYSGDGLLATHSWLNHPIGVAVDKVGNIYIADSWNSRIRKVDTNGIISTIVGGNSQGVFSGDGGPATQAGLNNPYGIAVDSAGNIYIADSGNGRIRKVDTYGIITTVAGNGQSGFSGDGGPATQADLSVAGVTVDSAGNIYVADELNSRIRKITYPPTIIPGAPTTLTVSAVSSSLINLAWMDNAINEEGFKIERSMDGVNFTQVNTVSANISVYSDTGLAASTSYYYRVRAYNSTGDSAYSNMTNANTRMPAASTPLAPANLSATVLTGSAINLSWTDTSDNEDGFRIERSTDGVNFTQINTVSENKSIYSDTGLAASTSYYYRVRAYNSVGDSVYSNTANATTLQVSKLPTTGQTISYDPIVAKRDDGALQDGIAWPIPRFTVGTGEQDGCITDNLTGLMWVRSPEFAEKWWTEALANANELSLCGYSDWRLPNRKELRSLINYGQINSAMWLNTQGFNITLGGSGNNMYTGNYWTSTTYLGETDYAWVVGMSWAQAVGMHKYSSLADVPGGFVLPVRAGEGVYSALARLPKTGQSSCFDSSGSLVACISTGQDGDLQTGDPWPLKRFAINNDTTVTDNVSGLAWAPNGNLMPGRDINWNNDDGVNDGIVTWPHALDYIAKLNAESYLGHNDWRLPNVNEIESLVHAEYSKEICSGLPCSTNADWLNTQGFSNVQTDMLYLSSTSVAGVPAYEWSVSMDDGSLFRFNDLGYVWPVRIAQAAQASPVVIGTQALLSGAVGVAYSQTLTATGGQTPYTWSIMGGSLPAGLTLQSTTGVISGTPTTAGTSNVTVQVADANHTTAIKEFSLTITNASPPATGVTLSSNVASPQMVGTQIMFTSQGSGGSGTYEYQYWLKTGSTWAVVRDYSTTATWTWDTTGIAAGTYGVMVYVRNVGSAATYEVAKSMSYSVVTNPPATGATLTPSVASPQVIGTSIVFTASGSGGSGTYEYQYWLKTGSTWTVIRDYTTTSTWTWDMTGIAAGTYGVMVYVRNTGSPATYEFARSVSYSVVTNPPATGVTLSSNVASPQVIGTQITFTSQGSGGSGTYEYQYWYRPAGSTTYSMIRDYATTNTWTWDTTGATPGANAVMVYVRNAGSAATYEVAKSMSYTVVTNPPATGVTLSSNVASPQVIGTQITFTSQGSGGSGTYEYQYWYRPAGSTTYSMIRDYATTNTWTWDTTGATPGANAVMVYVRNAGSAATYEVAKSMSYTVVTNPPATGVTLSSNVASPQVIGTSVAFTSQGSGGSGTYEYQYWYRPAGSTTYSMIRDYGTTNAWTWDTTGATPGANAVMVYVRNVGSAATYEVARSMSYTVVSNPPVTAVTLAPSVTSPQVIGTSVIFTATATGGSGTYEYQYWHRPAGSTTYAMIRDYASGNTWIWDTTSATPGANAVMVYVRNVGSAATYEVAKSLSYTVVTNPPATGATLTSSVASPQVIGTQVTFTSQGSGDSGSYEYQYWYRPAGSTTYSMIRDYATTNTWTWDTTSAAAGAHAVMVYVRNVGSAATYEVARSASYSITQ